MCTGLLKFYYRTADITPLFDKTDLTANAAHCANEQGAFWQMYNELFSSQMNWTELSHEGATAYFVDVVASQLGLNQEQLAQCIAAMKYQKEVDKDKQALVDLDSISGGSYGIPFFVIILPKTGTDLGLLNSAAYLFGGSVLTGENSYILFAFKAIFDSYQP
ncbi:thioredoxin domain-containing protein [Candidatus Micrarchaeota archaeon]|nr:thioredoxin domain-containing protein [Candidatus Micrarchaeota archaeon]